MKKIEDVNNLERYIKELSRVGFQSSLIGEARKLLTKMFSENSTILLSFTANLVASGIRGYLTQLVKKKKVNALITTAGALEHDVMKSFSEYYIGDFELNDYELHKRGINRVGNILIKNRSYEILESINMEIFSNFKRISPSELAYEYGRYIEKKSENKEGSILYNAYKNDIPVFCPGITDGAIGLNAYFYKKKSKETIDFDFDVAKDLDRLGTLILNAEKTGGIVLGGGISKHHLLGSNIIRGGLDYAIYVSTAVEYDGSLSGAKPKEAISWGKIKEKNFISINGEVSIVLPLLLERIL